MNVSTPQSMRPIPAPCDRRPRSIRRPRARKFAATCAAAALALLAAHSRTHAQDQSPVYVEDSPAAAEAIERAHDLANVGNLAEASRVLQSLLDDRGTLLVPGPGDPDLFIETRSRVNDLLLDSPPLLETYVRLESPTARAMLETGDHRRAESTRLLTPAGFDATLRVAQEQLEGARFGAAWITLLQLEPHPARTGERAVAAARLAELIARYLDGDASPTHTERVWTVVRRWRAEAGLEGEPDRRLADRPTLSRDVTPYDRIGEVELTGILPKPLASAPMGETLPDPIKRLAGENRTRTSNDTALVLHAMPTIAGDTVYVNDSEVITAFDRFTLTRKWRTSLIGPPASAMSGGSPSGLEDTNGVAVADPYVVVLTGLSLRGRQSRERLLGALDVDTGNVLWTTSLAQLVDPTLEEGLLRGPVEVSEGTVMLTVVRSVNRQRLLSVSVLAFDLESGQLRWTRQIGSIGVVPWVMRPEATELALVHEGVMYRTDRIGVVAAIEVDTGRLRWIRRMERDFEQRGPIPEAWEGSRPIHTEDGRLILLSPDRRRIAVLDAETGRLIDSAQSIRLGQPDYLLPFGDYIVGVEKSQITARRVDRLLDTSPSLVLAEFPRGGILGRVVVSGDTLMVPFVDGLRLVRLQRDAQGDPEPATRLVELDEPGHTLAAPGQIVTVDDVRVHSYLSWSVADRLLRDRMSASPRDASPAITYAELAYRAGRPDRILEAVDRAVATIERDPLSDESERARKRLFAALLEMIEPSPGSRPGSKLDDAMREQVIGRMSRVATTPPEQVAYLMAAGRIYESTRRPELAVERYQEILSSPVLARTIFQEAGRRLPAEAEATRRLRRLIRLEGRAVYAAYEAEAQRLLAEAQGQSDPEPFDRIARRYPVSRQAPRAWLAAADRYRDRAMIQKAILSLEEGLAAGEDSLPPADPLLGELAGRLISALIEKDRLILAEQRLENIRLEHPSLVLSVDGNAIDTEALAGRIRARLGERRRRPRIAPELGDVRTIEGWTLVQPIDPSAGARLTDRVMMQSNAGERGMWALDENDRLTLRWTIPAEGEFLRIDHRSVYVSTIAEGARAHRTVARHDLGTGELIWISPPFGELFDGPDPFENIAGGVPVVDTPLQPDAPLADLFAVFDAETMVLIERTGRAAAFDIESGDLLWAHERGAAPIQPVHDVAAGNGFVAIGGLRLLPPGQGERDLGSAFESVVAAYDLRTGALMFEHVDDDTLRWLRVTPEGHLLAGMDAAMASFDVFRQLVRWRSERNAVHDTIGAWVLPGRAVYRDNQNALRIINTADGTGNDDPLLVEGRLDSGFAQAAIVPIDGRMALATRRGVVLLGANGALLGVDARHNPERVLMPTFAEDHVVMLEQRGVPVGADDEFNAYDLSVFDLESVKLAAPTVALELGATPSDLQLLDGKVLVSAGMVTLVIDAPPAP